MRLPRICYPESSRSICTSVKPSIHSTIALTRTRTRGTPTFHVSHVLLTAPIGFHPIKPPHRGPPSSVFGGYLWAVWLSHTSILGQANELADHGAVGLNPFLGHLYAGTLPPPANHKHGRKNSLLAEMHRQGPASFSMVSGI
jgi:hypothetical protein